MWYPGGTCCTVWLFCCGGARRDFKHSTYRHRRARCTPCNFFVGKETYLDVMFMYVYLLCSCVVCQHILLPRPTLGLFLFFVSRVGSIHCQLVVPALQTTIHLSNSSLIFQSRTVGSRIAVAFGLPRWSNWYNNATIDGGSIP